MNPFVLAEQLKETALDYLRTTFHLSDAAFEAKLFDFLSGPEGMFRGPYVDLRLPFRKAQKSHRIPLEIKPPFVPHAHQVRAFERLFSSMGHQPQHTLVVTGTGSGKTECFLYPILDHCYRHRHQPGIKAIILYPMNALASDQARRIAGLLWNDERLKGAISAGLYVGGKGQRKEADAIHLIDDKAVLRENPPDILLTNYKMLDFLMLRPDDKKLWQHNGPETLRYLVLDELHTYDGAQGSDVACLIRRLKARLGVKPGALCAVGTSATVGAGSTRQSALKLTEFATQVFGEYFTTDGVIEEDRQELDEIIDLEDLDDHIPLSTRTPESYPSPEEYLRDQERLWLRSENLTPVQRGLALQRHRFTRNLLQSVTGKLLSLPELAAQVARFSPDFQEREPQQQKLLLQSFLSLITSATRLIEKQELPFLTCQSQLWVRELRHLTYHLGEQAFHWREGASTPEPVFPPISCQDCGQHFLLGLQLEASTQLQNDLGKIGLNFKERRSTCRVIELLQQAEEGAVFLSPDLKLSDKADEGSIPIKLHRELSDSAKPKFLARCPACDSDDSLIYVASRAATLTGVLTSHLFGSDFNRDKKLLAFTDSVQDASHLAGFLASRTYRFGLRSALQTVVEGQACALADLPSAVLQHWEKQKGLAGALVTLWPPDLQDLPEYREFQEKPGSGLPKHLRSDFLRRLAWEIYSEYGFNAQVGRSLERSGCSTAYPEIERLEAAVSSFQRDLVERQPLLLSPGFPIEKIRHFLQGILQRLRVRGAIHHPFLSAFLKNGTSNRYLLGKKHQRWMAPLQSERLPRFLLNSASPHFDHFSGPATRPNWYRDWAHRCFGCERIDDGIYDLYRFAVKRLLENGILSAVNLNANQEAYGLAAEHLLCQSDPKVLECQQCAHSVQVPPSQVPHWQAQSCLLYRCEGSYRAIESEPNYYARIYRGGQVERVFPYEHTGLLERHERESLEDDFKSSGRPGSANLLVCTPTLEMGVDVGDLSAVMACSVPPATSNYLQRMGRAGRKTGNALCLTMVESQPHDLYFFNAPMEMIRGQVLPPGCFLQAPEMLQRQLIAFSMDQWARQETALPYLQKQIQAYLSSKGRQEFPGRVIAFFEQHRTHLLEQFFELFAQDLTPALMEELKHFAFTQEIPHRLESAVQAVAQERERYRKLMERCKQRLEELAQTPEAMLTKDILEEKQELENSRRVLYRLIKEVVQKYPLNVLTDAGVLPNYAFPEPGVSLRATVLYRNEDGQAQVEPKTHEYMRPASNALRELAPHNRFYAEGRKIRINEVSLGSKHEPLLEEWRVCDNCSFACRSEAPEASTENCPGCQSARWRDQGQLLSLVRMQQVSALCDVLTDRNTDEQDQRESLTYHTLDLISVGPGNYAGQSYQIPSLPFGAELLRRLTLREINFGLQGEISHLIQVAGKEVPDRGFHLCFDCGRVQAPKDQEIHHAPYCKHRKGKFNPNQGTIYLYREITSEAIRLLLPAATLEVDEQLASFKAALMLGFRRKFQGNPLHLLIRRQSEPVSGAVRRNFLVIYDAVPGGTGYLAEMARPEGMQEILSLAREALTGCSCRTDPQRDGCYRCLFAYQNQYELNFVSRRRALEMLAQILEAWETRQSCVTLSDVRLDERLESELEALFLERLKKAVLKDKGGWSEGAHAGAKSYHLKLGARNWLLRPQVPLGKCRPDFLLVPEWAPEGERSIAIFCDGLEYHVCPNQLHSRLADDLEKRTQLLQSGTYWIFNVTWDDLTANTSSPEVVQQLLSWLRGGEASETPAWEGQRALAESSLKTLFQGSDWAKRGNAQALQQAQQQMVYSLAPQGYSLAAEVSRELLGASERRAFAHLGCWWSPQGKVSLRLEHLKMVLRLFDSVQERQQEAFKDSWRWFLRQWNRYQFLPNCQVTSTSLLEKESLLVELAAEPLVPYRVAPQPAAAPDPWAPLREQVQQAALPLLEELRTNSLPLPEVGYELLDGAGRVLADAELAWPEQKTAWLLGAQWEEQPAWEGWQVFSADQLEALISHLRDGE